jgi:sugar/nucleoside kinase (ribokinase family)
MVGCCGGSDALGEFGRAQMTAAGVDIISVDDESTPWAGSATGTVMVFTTPDAQRSFLSSFSSEDRLWLSPQLLSAVSKARLLVVEGYLWELPGAAEVIPAVVKHARAVGTLVVLTAGDASVVQRHGGKVLETIQAGVDMFVSNVAEAQALQTFLREQQQQQSQQADAQAQRQSQQEEMQLHSVLLDAQGSASLDSMWEATSSSSSVQGADGSSSDGQLVACELAGVCPLVLVTDGSRGSYITALGQLIVVPPYWRSHAPVDTCGAGDAYCSGFLFAFLLGLDLHAMGHIAAKTASAVISRHGPQLLAQDADAVAGVPLRKGSLVAQFMGVGGGSGSNTSSSTSVAAMQLQSLGLDVDASVGASQLVQSASQ